MTEEYDQFMDLMVDNRRKLDELEKAGICVGIKCSKLYQENLEYMQKILTKFNFALMTGFGEVELTLDLNEESVKMKCFHEEFVNGIKVTTLLTWYDEGKDIYRTEVEQYCFEKCEECVMWNHPDYDIEYKYHEKYSRIGYMNSDNDIDGKGGMGYWTFVKSVNKRGISIFTEDLYKNNPITNEQLKKMLGCEDVLIALDSINRSESVSGFMSNTTFRFDKIRKIKTKNNKITCLARHCKSYKPKDKLPNPVKQLKVEELRI